MVVWLQIPGKCFFKWIFEEDIEYSYNFAVYNFTFSLDCHVVEIEVIGPGIDQTKFHLKTVRTNPAKTGAVTGKATYNSFLSSMLGKGNF